jgi:hypothetical protein
MLPLYTKIFRSLVCLARFCSFTFIPRGLVVRTDSLSGVNVGNYVPRAFSSSTDVSRNVNVHTVYPWRFVPWTWRRPQCWWHVVLGLKPQEMTQVLEHEERTQLTQLVVAMQSPLCFAHVLVEMCEKQIGSVTFAAFQSPCTKISGVFRNIDSFIPKAPYAVPSCRLMWLI